MKTLLSFSIGILLLISSLQVKDATAQIQERSIILASDIVNTTLNGAMLGSATMGLQNSADYKDPLRIGVGLGILAGVGLAAYDLVQFESGRELVHGTFVSGNNSSVVLLIDTMYGAAAGSVIGTAVILIANKPITDGLQYGASLGGWMGFGFGLLDTFVLSRNRTMSPMGGPLGADLALAGTPATESKIELDFLKPDLTHVIHVNGHMGAFGGEYIPRPVLNVLEVKFRF